MHNHPLIEYRALAVATSEIAWVKALLLELGVKLQESPSLLCDNVGTTHLSLNPIMHLRMKHIAINLHFVQDYVTRGALKVGHVSIEYQLANKLTKPFPRLRFKQLSSKIGVIDGTPLLQDHINDLNDPQSTDIININASPSATSVPKSLYS